MIDRGFEIKTCQFTIPLPKEVKVLIEKGERVLEGELLARGQESFQEFNLVKILKIEPQKLGGCLLVSPGAKVKEGDVLAQRKSFLAKLEFKSPISGVFSELLPEGFLKIKVGEKREIKSPVKAQVYQVKPADCLILEFEAAVLIGEHGEGEENWGEIEILDKEEEIGLADLPPVSSGKIFVTRGKISPGFIHKAEALEAAGIVGGTVEDKIKTVGLAIITIEAKDGLIPQDLWGTLKKYEKKMALISGQEKTLKIPLD